MREDPALEAAAGGQRTAAPGSVRPLIAREAVMLLRSRANVSIQRAKDDLGYHPLVRYDEAMKRVANYLGERE